MWLPKGGDKTITDLLITIPIADTFGQRDAEQFVRVQNFWQTMEQGGDLDGIQHRWAALLEWLFVILRGREEERKEIIISSLLYKYMAGAFIF